MKWVIFDLDGTLSRTDIFIVPDVYKRQKQFRLILLMEHAYNNAVDRRKKAV